MKFLCDNCKAKYQIADEKVAGKTVRMKCRKCGHQIEVRAAITETSAASQPPKPMQTPSAFAPRPGGAGAPPPPKPVGGGLATSLSATKPRSPQPSVAPNSALAGAFQRNVEEAPRSTSGSALDSLTKNKASSTIELSVTDEWYVAINGVPVGPVRISELRRKAAAGAVTEESLCWQEGLEEWRPIRSIPDLAALVREAAQGNRPSLLSAPHAEPGRPSIPSAPMMAPSAPRQHATSPSTTARGNTAPPPPRPMTPSAPSVGMGGGGGRSNVVPLRPAASASSPSLDGGGASAAAAFSLTPPPPSPFQTPQPLSSPMMPIAPAADPFALPPLAPNPNPYNQRDSGFGPMPGAMGNPSHPSHHSIAPSPSMYPMGPTAAPTYDQGKKGVPLWFWPILLVALGFGGGVAFLVFRPQPTPQPVVIQMPATATAQPTAESKPGDNIPPPPDVAPTASEAKPNGTRVAVRGATPKTGSQPAEQPKGLDLGGLVPAGGGGPNVGPNGPSGGAGGGLDQAGVERVVAVHRNGVKRTCWERGGSDQKSSVNVTVTANVAPNGSVASTSSTGDDPVVAKCIENQVRTWQFPAPGASTTINIPFKFVRQ